MVVLQLGRKRERERRQRRVKGGERRRGEKGEEETKNQYQLCYGRADEES